MVDKCLEGDASIVNSLDQSLATYLSTTYFATIFDSSCYSHSISMNFGYVLIVLCSYKSVSSD